MSEAARPYSAAAFAHARQNNAVDAWSAMLNGLAAAEADIAAASRMAPAALADLLAEALELKDADQRNFLHILAEYRRLDCLGDIARRFTELRDQDEGCAEIHVELARPMDDGAQAEFSDILAKWSGQKTVRVSYSENPELLGGMRIRMRDQVMDVSVRGRLNRLAAVLA